MESVDIIIIVIFVIVVGLLIGLNMFSADNTNIIVLPPLPNNQEKVQEGFSSTNTESKANIKNPDDNNIIEYGNYVCYKKGTEVKNPIENKITRPSCKNESLNNKFRIGKGEIKETVGNCPKNNLPENWYEMDPSLYYRMNKPPIAPIEDELIKGYNIGTYGKTANIYDIGRINLNNMQNKYAQPNNYIL